MIYFLAITLIGAIMTIAFTYQDFKKGKVAKSAFRILAILDTIIIVSTIIGAYFALRSF